MQLIPGSVYSAMMRREDGITVRYGREVTRKYFVVLGEDNMGNVIGGVVINSNINPTIAEAKQLLHYPISKEQYPFLEHDSFVNCVDIKVVPTERLLQADFSGMLLPEDLNNVHNWVRNSIFVTEADLKRFGL